MQATWNLGTAQFAARPCRWMTPRLLIATSVSTRAVSSLFWLVVCVNKHLLPSKHGVTPALRKIWS